MYKEFMYKEFLKGIRIKNIKKSTILYCIVHLIYQLILLYVCNALTIYKINIPLIK